MISITVVIAFLIAGSIALPLASVLCFAGSQNDPLPKRLAGSAHGLVMVVVLALIVAVPTGFITITSTPQFYVHSIDVLVVIAAISTWLSFRDTQPAQLFAAKIALVVNLFFGIPMAFWPRFAVSFVL